MKFQKKPVTVDAFRYLEDAAPAWFTDAIAASQPGHIIIFGGYCRIGDSIAHKGDWIIQQGCEIYTCNPTVFEQKYEPLTTSITGPSGPASRYVHPTRTP